MPHGVHIQKIKAIAHKDMEELEDSFVGQNVQDVSRLWIDDWQPVDSVSQ